MQPHNPGISIMNLSLLKVLITTNCVTFRKTNALTKTGLEPTTNGLWFRHSTFELFRHRILILSYRNKVKQMILSNIIYLAYHMTLMTLKLQQVLKRLLLHLIILKIVTNTKNFLSSSPSKISLKITYQKYLTNTMLPNLKTDSIIKMHKTWLSRYHNAYKNNRFILMKKALNLILQGKVSHFFFSIKHNNKNSH